MKYKKYIYCAIDFKKISEAKNMLSKIKNHIGGIKLGLEFFIANGLKGIKLIKKYNLPIFLDLKLHDIPITVFKSLEAALDVEPEYISVHITGGSKMIELITKKKRYTKLIGITMLTSLEQDDIKSFGIKVSPKNYVKKLAAIAYKNGLDGIVSSPKELKYLRQTYSKKFIIITPGIRLNDDINEDDQKRIQSPGEAVFNGSNILIIGRPITKAKDPIKSLELIDKDINQRLNRL